MMAKFQIDEDTWVQNYPYMITVTGLYRIKALVFTSVVMAIIVMSLLTKQYLGAVVLILNLILITKRFWENKKILARKSYKASVMASAIQEVCFSEAAINITFEGCVFQLDWQGIQKTICLPELLYIKHKVLHFYILSKALSENESALLYKKLNELNITTEDRKNKDIHSSDEPLWSDTKQA